MNIKSRSVKLMAVSLGVALLISVPVALLVSTVLGSAAFGAVCLISFVFNFRQTTWMSRSPIILGVIIGLVLQVAGALPYMGGAAVIFFAGVGALFTMLTGSTKFAEVG